MIEPFDLLGVHPEMRAILDTLPQHEQRAFAIVYLAQCGHGYDLGNPRNRAQAISWWSEFLPARVRIAARTCSSLAEVCSSLASRLKGQIGGKGEEGERHRQVYLQILAAPDGEQSLILDALERQSQALVTLVRADLDLKKQESQREELYGKSEDQQEREPESRAEPGLFDAIASGVPEGEPV